MIEILEYDGKKVNGGETDMLSCYVEQEKPKKRITNTDRVLMYMQTHKDGISSIQAFHMFGVTRLAAIIYNLRHFKHLNIESVDCSGRNRFGAPVTFTTYILKEDE